MLFDALNSIHELTFIRQRLKEWFHRPYQRMLRDHPRVAEVQPFECVLFNPRPIYSQLHFCRIQVKIINLSYHIDKVFNEDIPKLEHGNDGLIYTCVNTPYTPGTDNNM
jgi:mRNA guanylyltransferase